MTRDEILFLIRRNGVRVEFVPHVTSVLHHCSDEADAQESLREMRRNQPQWFRGYR